MYEYMLGNETDPLKKIDGADMKLNDCVLRKIYKNTRSKADKNNVNAAKGTTESDQGAIDLPAVSNIILFQINQFSVHLFLLVNPVTLLPLQANV
ncbi:NAC domain-containing protein 67-like [Pyrus ussuriensis x Pyrus communis]|uniref:NAC domain-containing protein 67-like n=1 Tax=Pyrus ussuriensis x Pyrus communis TaxID=2448454 RepID=A0A5N5FZC3_9ROSA|nr:NAC domain-containing protein 67-like [Pyrus ussuriensis x Pyrus communis]